MQPVILALLVDHRDVCLDNLSATDRTLQASCNTARVHGVFLDSVTPLAVGKFNYPTWSNFG